MLARMEPILVFSLLLGAGALVLSVKGRRAQERQDAHTSRAPATAIAPRKPAANAAASGCSNPVAAGAAPAPAPLARVPDPALPERRKHVRIQSDQTFTITPFAGRAMLAQCRDVSLGGMRFGVVGCTLRAGDLARVTFNIGSETVEAIGSVLRVQELDPITCDVSLEFVRVDPWAAELLEQALQTDT